MSDATSKPAKVSPEADRWASHNAARLLSGRKGHGGGPCTTRVLSEAQLYALLALAFDAGRASVKDA